MPQAGAPDAAITATATPLTLDALATAMAGLFPTGTPSPQSTSVAGVTAIPPEALTAEPAGVPVLPAVTLTPDYRFAELLARINDARQTVGEQELGWSPELAAAADAQAQDMATHNFLGHTGSDNSDVTTRMRRAGYVGSRSGEIVTEVSGGPDTAFEEFWNSKPHHDLILDAGFQDVSVARAPSPLSGGPDYYVVVFGTR